MARIFATYKVAVEQLMVTYAILTFQRRNRVYVIAAWGTPRAFIAPVVLAALGAEDKQRPGEIDEFCPKISSGLYGEDRVFN